MTNPLTFTFYTPGPINQLNRNERAAKILDSIPEFSMIRESYANITRPFDEPPLFDRAAAGEQLRVGAHLEELALDAALKNRILEDFRSSVTSISAAAEGDHDADVRTFLHTHTKAFAAGVLDEYTAIKAAAKDAMDVLGEDLTEEQILDNPDTWAAWKQLKNLATELDAWRSAQHALTGIDHVPREWPYLDVLANYGEAWPAFQRTGTQVNHLSESVRITVHAEPAPWRDTVSLLRDIVRRDLTLWSPTAQEFAAEIARLETVAGERQKEDMRAAREAGSMAGRM